ncbi:MAG: L-threonylcarbamoyladenylate synthase [Firmicutes bacterium]|nr:L-threonylcarbamoyladenylate synthase [Bacillota bacterium]
MKTEVLPLDAASLERAALSLRAGEVAAFPTETVYGLGADALNAQAVGKIYAAKGRPADNPLIVHIAELGDLDKLITGADARARALMGAFWPGPLTLILPRGSRVPDVVSAGLDTVAVRMPSHPAALALIRAAGTPLAAPSANRSGRPSPTTAAHVLADMDGRVPLILDGGACSVGVESTVLDLTRGQAAILRPGGVTLEMLRTLLPEVRVDEAVLRPLAAGGEARSPGMKHRHYAPAARVIVVTGGGEARAAAIRGRYDAAALEGQRAVILCQAGHAALYGDRKAQVLGDGAGEMAANLFAALREADAQGMELILAEAIQTEGMGLALMNRLLRAADFEVAEAGGCQNSE